MDIGEMISKYRKEKGMTIDQLVDASGVPKGTINKIIGGITKTPTLENVRAIAYALGKTLSDFDDVPAKTPFLEHEIQHMKKYRLLDEHGKEAVESILDVEYQRMVKKDEMQRSKNRTFINCYDLPVSAGTGQPLGDTDYKTTLEIPTDRVPNNTTYCLRVSGDSMEPIYSDGDIVFVHRQDGNIREGEIGIFVLNGESFIKRLGNQELISLNPKYEPIPLMEYDDLLCQGTVLGKL